MTDYSGRPEFPSNQEVLIEARHAVTAANGLLARPDTQALILADGFHAVMPDCGPDDYVRRAIQTVPQSFPKYEHMPAPNHFSDAFETIGLQLILDEYQQRHIVGREDEMLPQVTVCLDDTNVFADFLGTLNLSDIWLQSAYSGIATDVLVRIGREIAHARDEDTVADRLEAFRDIQSAYYRRGMSILGPYQDLQRKLESRRD